MARGPYKKGTTVYASSCRVYKVSAKIQYVYIALCIHIIYIYIYIYIYNIYIIHMVISGFGVFVNTIRLNECE